MRSTFGTITRRGHNVYRLQWLDRSSKRHSKTIHGTRSAAQKELSRIELGLSNNGEYMPYSDYWELYVEPTFKNLKPKTVFEYKRLWNVELEPRIGSWNLTETTWRDVQRVIDDIASSSVQRKAFVLWRKVCNMALRDDLILKNPCAGIKFKQHTKREKKVLDTEGVTRFLKAIKGIKYEPLLLVLLGGGLRVSEACALSWSDISQWQEYAAVSVSKALVTVDGDAVMQDTTKTEKSTRVVIIGEPFASRLLALKSEGALCDAVPVTVSHNFKSWCARHDIEHIRLGDFRSVYTTLCGEAGCPDSLVSMQLGHTDGTTRGEHYQQVTNAGKALVAATLAAYLGVVK